MTLKLAISLALIVCLGNPNSQPAARLACTHTPMSLDMIYSIAHVVLKHCEYMRDTGSLSPSRPERATLSPPLSQRNFGSPLGYATGHHVNAPAAGSVKRNGTASFLIPGTFCSPTRLGLPGKWDSNNVAAR